MLQYCTVIDETSRRKNAASCLRLPLARADKADHRICARFMDLDLHDAAEQSETIGANGARHSTAELFADPPF